MPNEANGPSSAGQPAGSAGKTFKDTLGPLLSHLAGLVRVSFDADHAKLSINRLVTANTGTAEPLETLQSVAAECCMSVSPAPMSVADALWMSRDDQPLIAWSPVLSQWMVIQRHGFFRARVSTPDRPLERESIPRMELARRLGVANLNDRVEFGVVFPERPAEALRGGAADRPASLLPAFHIHQDAHHEHVSPIRRLLWLLKTEMPDVWTIIIFSVVTGVLYLALPIAVNSLVSNLAFGGRSGPFMQALLALALALFLCLALSATVRGLQHYVAEVIQRRIFVRIAADLAYRLPRVDASSLDGVHAPEVVNRFLDVVTVQKSASLLLLSGVNAVLGAVIGMMILGFYHPFLLAFVIVLIALLGFIMFVLGRRAIPTAIQESICKYEVVNWLEEIARYPRLFKGPGGYALAAERADRLTRSYLTARRGHFRVLMRQIMGLLTLEVLAGSSLLIVGGWLVINAQLTLGQLVASELIVSAIVASIAKLGKHFEAWYDAVAATDKLGHLVDLEIEREDGDAPPARANGAAVEVRDLAFGYHEGHPVFANVSFSLAPGDRVALKGMQGSGASTLVDLLHGLRMPTAGHITIDGLDIRSWSLEALRGQVMLIRSHDIVSGTVADNVRLGRADIGLDEVDRALQQVGLRDEVLGLPQGLNTPLITGGLPLSTRQRTRLLLARAIVMKPRLLLLDDILDGMDDQSLDLVTGPVFDRARGWTVLIATREQAVVKSCDRCIDIDNPACHPAQANH